MIVWASFSDDQPVLWYPPKVNGMRQGGLQRDVVYLNWPLAPSHMSPNAGGRGELRGLSQRVQLCTWSPNKHWRSTYIFNLWEALSSTENKLQWIVTWIFETAVKTWAGPMTPNSNRFTARKEKQLRKKTVSRGVINRYQIYKFWFRLASRN